MCEAWRVLHDRVVDSSFGWMSAFVERFGETAVPEMYEEIGGDHFAEFFALADPERRAWDDEGSGGRPPRHRRGDARPPVDGSA